MSTSIDSPRPSRILFGKSRGAVLSLLFTHVDEAFYLRQIARSVGFGLGPVQRELRLLTDAGIIRRTVSGRQVYFRANRESPIFPELKSLIAKTVGVGDTLRNALSPIANLMNVAFIYGSVAQGEEKPLSDVDVIIVGDVSFSDAVLNLQAAQKVLNREVNPSVYSSAEFRAKLREKHHFLTSVLNGPRIFLIGDDSELARLAPKRLARRVHDQPN